MQLWNRFNAGFVAVTCRRKTLSVELANDFRVFVAPLVIPDHGAADFRDRNALVRPEDVDVHFLGSILPTIYVQLLRAQSPKAQKRQSTQAAFCTFGICWWNWLQVSISPTFFGQLLRWFPFAKKLQKQTVSTEKFRKTLKFKNDARKMLMKLTPGLFVWEVFWLVESGL